MSTETGVAHFINSFRRSPSFIVCVASVIILLISNIWIRQVHYDGYVNMLAWDVLSYYLYLPFIFIYDDPGIMKQEVIRYIFDTYHPSPTFYQAYITETGFRIPAYTMGFAILYSPFFLIAHVWAKLGAYPADGFSFPYQFCIANGVLLYILPGLFLLRKFLLRYFDDFATSVTLLLIVFGTNYFHEAVNDALMPHAILFTGYALLLLLIDNWYMNPSFKNSVFLGLTGGIILLARGSEIVLIFIALLWKVDSAEKLKERFGFYLSKPIPFLLLVFSAFIVFVPQLIHWKAMTGSFLYNSYRNTEGVDWANPNLLNILISFKKSLLVYTPFFAFMLIGILLLRKRHPGFFIPVLVFTAANYYLLSCWAAWWNGYSFGMRYFVESWAVMGIPVAALVEWIRERRLMVKVLLVSLISFIVFLNLFQTWQYVNYMLDGSRITKAYYKALFLKTSVPPGADKLLEIKRSDDENDYFTNEGEYYKRTIAYYNFEDLNTTWVDPAFLDSTRSYEGKYSCRLDGDHIFSPTFRIPYYILTKKDHAWIRVKFHYRMDSDMSTDPVSLVVTMSRYGKGGRPNNKYRAIDLSTKPFKAGEWNSLTFEYVTPMPLHEKDELTIYLWHRGSKPFYYDNLRIDAFEMK